VVDAVVALAMAASKSEARRLIDQGGVKLNDKPVQSATATITSADLDEGGTARLTVGKKRHALIKREG
jgi:tyrosyl-tRNA synthetase